MLAMLFLFIFVSYSSFTTAENVNMVPRGPREEEEKEYETKKVLKKTLKRKAYTQVKAKKQIR